MLLSTMTYEEIYQGIIDDSYDLFIAITKKLSDFQKLAKRARHYPYGRVYSWKHPKSQNNYIYFFEVKRHSDWDKTPRLLTITEIEEKEGKKTIEIARDPDGTIRLSIFINHFFQRYYERYLSKYTEFTPKLAHDLLFAFLIRTSTTMPLGSQLASLKEKEKKDPDFEDEAILTPEGLLQCKRYKKNPNIVLFKTYLSIQDLFEKQYEEVTMNLIHVVYLRACEDSPRYQKGIDKIYLDGIADINKLWNDPTIPFNEKQEKRMARYGEVLDELYKYII